MTLIYSKRYRTDEIAKIWDVSQRTVAREIQRGRLPAVRIGRVLRVSEEALTEYEKTFKAAVPMDPHRT